MRIPPVRSEKGKLKEDEGWEEEVKKDKLRKKRFICEVSTGPSLGFFHAINVCLDEMPRDVFCGEKKYTWEKCIAMLFFSGVPFQIPLWIIHLFGNPDHRCATLQQQLGDWNGVVVWGEKWRPAEQRVKYNHDRQTDRQTDKQTDTHCRDWQVLHQARNSSKMETLPFVHPSVPCTACFSGLKCGLFLSSSRYS